MSHPASSLGLLPRRVVLVGVVVLAGVGCGGKKKGAPSLPAIQKYVVVAPWEHDQANKNLGYRSQAGQAIAPVVIADDPVPTEATPTNPGQAGGNVRTLNGDPRGITRETLNHSIQAAMGSLAACFTNITQDPMVAVSFEADPSGRPSLVRVNGAPADAERCIRSVVQNIRFPSFEGKGVQVDLPLSFHRTAGPAQPAPAPQQAAPPPLFMEP
jgi:hypothetical protein